MAEPTRGRRILRLVATAALAALCWVTFWWRPSPPVPADDLTISAHALNYAGDAAIGPFKITGAWRLAADKPGFDSLSALSIDSDGRLFAVSDRSRWYKFPKPGASGPTDVGRIIIIFSRSSGPMGDSESLVLDRASGVWWTSIENFKAVIRYAPDETSAYARVPLMAEWPANEGAEAMVRLRGGRFVIVAEMVSAGRDKTHPALLFAGDPIESGDPMPFHFAMPGGTVPVEAGLLPDGHVLILGRDFSLPFGFSTNIAIADPADIRIGAVWHAREVGWLRNLGLADNDEGMAIEQGPDGKLILWLVSDDNQARVMQRTLLLRLEAQASAL